MKSEIATLFLDSSIHTLDQMEESLKACLGRLNDVQVWQKQDTHENAIGNLILHLCGNMRQWIIHGVGDAPDVRTRDAEFSAGAGLTAAELGELFRDTAAQVKSILKDLPHDRLIERTLPQNYDVSVLEAIYHVVGHVQQHVGQIILLTKQMHGQDLDLTVPRTR
jgi:uncharacterized damage-inducible protein DinB